jgi:uncharacterized protein Smg (DUF494 family)
MLLAASRSLESWQSISTEEVYLLPDECRALLQYLEQSTLRYPAERRDFMQHFRLGFVPFLSPPLED